MATDIIRVPETTVLLVRVLGRIIREHLRFVPIKHEGWTFEHNADYVVKDSLLYQHNCSSYLGAARVNYHWHLRSSLFEVRIHALKNRWDALPDPRGEMWTFDVWLKTPRSSIGPHQFLYAEVDDHLILSDRKPEHTPRKIDLWWRQKLVP